MKIKIITIKVKSKTFFKKDKDYSIVINQHNLAYKLNNASLQLIIV
jgi:hypothetical protein